VVTFLALLAATAFALGTVLQQKGTLVDTDGTPPGADAASGVGGLRFLTQLFARPVWLLGGAVTAVGGVLNALALHWGTLAGVQALTTLSLVIALPFGVWLTDQRVTGTVWVGACLLVAGIVLFVAAGSPQPGTGVPSAADWVSAGLVSLVLAGTLARMGRGRRPALQAVIFGMAAGVGFGLASALTKQFTDVVGQGLAAILTGWELWALLAAGAVGLALGQSALRTGVLAPAMAATNAVTLFISVTLGVTVFGEKLNRADGALAFVVLGLFLVLVGIVLLARAPAPGSGERLLDVGQAPAPTRTPTAGG
jgi:drug/metabolite transporter (DMT)-like permease